MLIFSGKAKQLFLLGSDSVFTFGVMSCFWLKLTLTPLSCLMADLHEAGDRIQSKIGYKKPPFVIND